MVRVGVVSQCYDPEPGSAAVAGAICRALAGLGHDVHVLTGFPNYPTGKIFPGYRVKPYQYEHLLGVHVHRVPLMPSHDRSAVRRATTYLSFALSASLRWRILRSADVWLVISSQATAAIPAMIARWIHGKPYILHIHDLWPDTVVESGFIRRGRMLRIVARCLRAFCGASYRRAHRIAVTSPSMAGILARRGVAPQKLTVVPNWIDESVLRPVPRDDGLARELGLEGFVVMYAGSFGDLQGLESAVEAVRLLADLPDVRLVFIGSGVAEARLHTMARGMDNVMFLGQQPIGRMASLLALSDVQLVCLRDLPLFRAILPSKIQAAMASGRAIAGCVAGDAADLIERSGAGLVTPPGDAVALASALRQLHSYGHDKRDAMGRNGREFYLERLSAKAGGAALSNLIRRAVEEAA